jgi:hypothetical protein
MKNPVLYFSLTAAVAGCLLCPRPLTAQEREPAPRGEPGERPQRQRPPSGQGEAPRAEKPGSPGSNAGERNPENRPRQVGAFRVGGRVLIVWPQAEEQKQRELEEDLNTMMHLVERTVEKTFATAEYDEDAPRRFVPPINNNESQALFLEDYGVVFSFRTFVALQGTTQTNAAPSSRTNEQPDNRWERARQELFGGPDGSREFRPAGMQYDEVKVRLLKEQLLELLRDANHLRHLKPQHQIALVLSGPSQASSPPALKPNDSPEERRSVIERFRNQLNRSSSLVLRVKKADVDSFAAGKLTIEQFRDKVSVLNK